MTAPALLAALVGCAGAGASVGADAGSAPAHGHAAGTTVEVPEGAGYSEADVRFAMHMIPHHEQALVMTALVEARTDSRDIGLIAERIEVTQHGEIARMRRWLEERGHTPPPTMHPTTGAEPTDHDRTAHAGMPGMLSPEQMADLRAASGGAFDRLFLELMIQHHQGAIVMVRELFAAGGAQEPEMFQLASDIDADQRMEIQRMADLLANR